MTEAPQFRVFLKEGCYPEKLVKLFPDGIPCDDFYPLDIGKAIPKKFVFRVDHPLCSVEQYQVLFECCDIDEKSDFLTDDDHPFIIPWDAVKTVTDCYGNTPSLKLLKQSWQLIDNAKKHTLTMNRIEGSLAHLIIMGLQQALFISPQQETDLNPKYVMLAVELIEVMSKGNQDIKEAYLIGFPCEYIDQAKALLFPE